MSQVWYAFIMKRQMIKLLNLILIASLTVVMAVPEVMPRIMQEEMSLVVPCASVVQATTISQQQQQVQNAQNKLNNITNKIDTLSDEQALIEEQIDDTNAEIINTMASIGMKEEEIAAKEVELSDKQDEIDVTQEEYEAAKKREEQQYADMLTRIRMMYENGSNTYLNLFLEGNGLSGMLNRMDFVEHIYQYDRLKLGEYEETKNQVHDLWDYLEAEKAKLEEDKTQLELDKEDLENQKANLDTILAKKKQESSNYDAEIKKAKQEAAVAKTLLQQEQQKLAQLQAQQNAANATYKETSYTATIDEADGSKLGKKVAKYACQFIGNPYVYGGTSLTKGADCSGFVYRVYKDFGYNLPRTSYQQRSAGESVSYKDAEPGDLICYDGHIGIYIGGGMIVHASSKKTGIKVSKANYRSILSVRRIVD